MTALVFVACLLAAPDRCEEQSLLFVSPLNPVSCMMQAPREIAAWTATHPDFQVTSWRCEDAARRATKA